jgi:hypothetical protein
MIRHCGGDYGILEPGSREGVGKYVVMLIDEALQDRLEGPTERFGSEGVAVPIWCGGQSKKRKL